MKREGIVAEKRQPDPDHFHIGIDGYAANAGNIGYFGSSKVFAKQMNNLAALAFRQMRAFKQLVFHRKVG